MNTSRHIRLSFLSVLFLCLVVALTSCSKKDTVSDEPLMSGGGAGESYEEESAVETSGFDAGAEGGAAAAPAAELRTVYFDYDRYNIRSDGEDSIRGNADWLQQNGSATIQIEGHCDERGTIEYNLALGERRANAARRYLQRLGIDPSRISTISYGEERPANPGAGDAAWAENRRAEFVVLSQ